MIGMVARFGMVLEPNIKAAMRSIDLLAEKRTDFTFTVVGAIQSTEVALRIAKAAAEINDKHGRRVCVVNHSLGNEATRFIASVDMLVGYGRVCFEGMMYSKPTAVVGANGYAGVIEPDCDIASLSKFNFSGRNVIKENPIEFAAVLNQMINDSQRRIRSASYGHDWLKSNLSVEKAVDTHVNLYSNLLPSQHRDSLLIVIMGYAIMICGKLKTAYLRIKARFNKSYQ
jgi:hypothetical protein